MGRKIYVGNLPESMEEAELRALFEPKGAVKSINVMRDADSGKSRGFAFVEMISDEDASKVIEELASHSIDGRSLTVREVQKTVKRRRGDSARGGNRRDPNQKSDW